MKILITLDKANHEFLLREAETGIVLYRKGPLLTDLKQHVTQMGHSLLLSGTDYHPTYGRCCEGLFSPAGAEPAPVEACYSLLKPGDIRVRPYEQRKAFQCVWTGEAWKNGAKVVNEVEGDVNHLFDVGEVAYYRPRQNVIAARLAYQEQAGIKEYSPLSRKLLPKIVNNFSIGTLLTVEKIVYLLKHEYTQEQVKAAAEELVEQRFLENVGIGYQFVAIPPQK